MRDSTDTAVQLEDEECPLPLFTDEYIGFSVGRPDGWTVEYNSGIVWLGPSDPNDPTLAFVYPGWLQEGESIDAIAEGFVAGLNDVFTTDGGGLQWDPESGALVGSVNGVAVEGELWADQSDQYGQLSGGWSAEGTWSSVRETMTAIPMCFALFPGEPLFVNTVGGTDPSGSSATWEYTAPEGWNANAGSTALDISGGVDENGFAHAHVGFFGQPLPSIINAPDSTHDQYLDAYIQTVQSAVYWEVLERGEATPIGEFTDNLGLTWEMAETQMQTTDGDREMISVVITALTRWQNYTFAQLWQRDITADRWEEFAAITRIIQWSIRILQQQTGAGISPPVVDSTVSDIIAEVGDANAAVQDYVGNQFSDAMLNNDRVTLPDDPGTEIIVPSTSYDPAQCGAGQRPIQDPYTGDVVCAEFVTPPE